MEDVSGVVQVSDTEYYPYSKNHWNTFGVDLGLVLLTMTVLHLLESRVVEFHYKFSVISH